MIQQMTWWGRDIARQRRGGLARPCRCQLALPRWLLSGWLQERQRRCPPACWQRMQTLIL